MKKHSLILVLYVFMAFLFSCENNNEERLIGYWYVDNGHAIRDDNSYNDRLITPVSGSLMCQQYGYALYPDGKVECFNGFWEVLDNNKRRFLGNFGQWSIDNNFLVIHDPLQNVNRRMSIVQINKDTLLLEDKETQIRWIRFDVNPTLVDFDSICLHFSNGWSLRKNSVLRKDGSYKTHYSNDSVVDCSGQLSHEEMNDINQHFACSDILKCKREQYSVVVDGGNYTFDIYYQGNKKRISFCYFDAPMKTSWAILYFYNTLQKHAYEDCGIQYNKP